MSWYLSKGVFAASVGSDTVLLDLLTGRYFCLAGVIAAPLTREAPLEVDAELARAMAAAGLVSDAPAQDDLIERPAPPPARSLAPAPATSGAVRGVAAAVLDAAAGYRGRPLSRLVTEAAGSRLATAPAISPALLARAAAFQAWAPYAPLPAKCLLRAFLLLRHLRRGGHDAVWVFGVRTWPFRAHCWLQADDTVLDDPWERVARYAPILRV